MGHLEVVQYISCTGLHIKVTYTQQSQRQLLGMIREEITDQIAAILMYDPIPVLARLIKVKFIGLNTQPTAILNL